MADAANTAAAIVPCGKCEALNRLDLRRLDDRAKCARCGELLRVDLPTHLTDATFDRIVRGTSVPVLVDFHADWCGPCRIVAPVVEEFARARAGQVLVGKLDTDANPRTASRLGIRGIPTLIAFRDGAESRRHVGTADARLLASLVDGAGSG